MAVTAQRVALAGEYLVASYLLRYCDSAILAPEGHTSDIILDHENKLYRIQVKTTNSIYQKRNQQYYRWDFRSNRESNRQSKEQRYGSGQIDIFCFVALPLDKIFFLAYEETQNSVAKTIDNIIAINTKDTLLQALEQANKPPKLKPLDLE
jgi:hypothetical protein